MLFLRWNYIRYHFFQYLKQSYFARSQRKDFHTGNEFEELEEVDWHRGIGSKSVVNYVTDWSINSIDIIIFLKKKSD